MAGQMKYTHEEIMRRYNFTALRVASWQSSPSYSLYQTAGQQGVVVRQTPQMYRYVIPSENIPEPTDDEESEHEEEEVEAEVSGDLLPGDAASALGGTDDILTGILKNTTPNASENASTPVTVEEAVQTVTAAPPVPASIRPKEEHKPRSKGKLRSAWSKPSTKSKVKPAKVIEPKSEVLSLPAAVVIPPEAPSPPLQAVSAIDHIAAPSAQASDATTEKSVEPIEDSAPIPAEDTADILVSGDQTEQPAEVSSEIAIEETPNVSHDEPGESKESTSIMEDEESATIDEAGAAQNDVGDPISKDESPEEPSAVADVDAEEATSLPTAADAEEKIDPLACLLEELIASKVNETEVAAAELGNAMDDQPESRNESETTVEDSPKSRDESENTVEDLPKNTDDSSSTMDDTPQSTDEPESSTIAADDASVVASIESEDKHVTFAPGTPEPKPTKRKKRVNKDKNKRRPSVTKSDAPKPAIEISVPSTVVEPTPEAPLDEPVQDGLSAGDAPDPESKTVEEISSDVKVSPAAQKTASRPRSSSKSAGMFAAGGLLGFAAKAKSSKSSKVKDKKKKKGAEEEMRSEGDPSEAAVVGLGITSSSGIAETDKTEESIEAPAEVSEEVEAVQKDKPSETLTEVSVVEAVNEDEAGEAVSELPVVEHTQDEGAVEAQANASVVETIQEDEASVTPAEGPEVVEATQENKATEAVADIPDAITSDDSQPIFDQAEPTAASSMDRPYDNEVQEPLLKGTDSAIESKDEASDVVDSVTDAGKASSDLSAVPESAGPEPSGTPDLTTEEEVAVEHSLPLINTNTGGEPDADPQEEVSQSADKGTTLQSTVDHVEKMEDEADSEDFAQAVDAQEASETSNAEIAITDSKTEATGVIEPDASAVQEEHIEAAEALTDSPAVVSLPGESDIEVIENVTRQDSGFDESKKEPEELHEPTKDLESQQPIEQSVITGAEDGAIDTDTDTAILSPCDTNAETVLEADDFGLQTQDETSILPDNESTTEAVEDMDAPSDNILPTKTQPASVDDVATSNDTETSTEVADSPTDAGLRDESLDTTEQAAAAEATISDIASPEAANASNEVDHSATANDASMASDTSPIVASVDQADEAVVVADATSPEDDAAIACDTSDEVKPAVEVEHANEASVEAHTQEPLSLQDQEVFGEELAPAAHGPADETESQATDVAGEPSNKSEQETSLGEPKDAAVEETPITAESHQAESDVASTSEPAVADQPDSLAEEPEAVLVAASLEPQPETVALSSSAEPSIEADTLSSTVEPKDNSDKQPFVTEVDESTSVDTNTEPSHSQQGPKGTTPIVTEIVEPAAVDANLEPKVSESGGTKAFVPDIVIPAAVAANLNDSASSPSASRTSRRRTSERSDRLKSSRRRAGENSSRQQDFSSTENRGQRSRERRRSDEDADRKRRRDARKEESAHKLAEDERRIAEEEEHRRRRREARRAVRKAQKAEDDARLAREQAEATARREAEARRKLREQAATDRLKAKDGGAARPKLANLPFVSSLSTGSSVTKAGLLVRTKDERPRESRDGDKRSSREDDSRRRERRSSAVSKVASPVDAKPPPKHAVDSDRASTRSKTDGGSKRDPASNVDAPSRTTEGERRRRSEKPEGDHSQRRRRPSERSSKQSPTETKKSGFLSSIF